MAQRFLYFYKCRHCATWAATAGDDGRYVRCNGCGGSKKYEYRIVVNGNAHDERLWTYAQENGVAHLPIPEQPAFTCVRCAQDFPEKSLRYYRADGVCCRECYRAEDRPEPLLTPEEQAERAQAVRNLEREMLERQEAAYARRDVHRLTPDEQSTVRRTLRDVHSSTGE